MDINDMATVETLDNSIQAIVSAALEAGFMVFAPKRRDPRPAGFVEICLDTEGSFVTVGKPTHRWDDADITAPIKPSREYGAGVLVDYDGTPEDAIRAMREVCESPTVRTRWVKNPATLPNYGNKCMTTWPAGGESNFVEITF